MYKIEARIYVKDYYDMDVTCMAGCALKDVNAQEYVEDNAWDMVYSWFINLSEGVPDLQANKLNEIGIEIISVTPVEHWCEPLPKEERG